MATEVTMPRLSDSMEEGTIVAWLVAEGDPVKRGEPIVEIETDKATMPLEAEADGVLLRILVAEGDAAPLGAPIAYIGAPGEEVPGAAPAPAPAAVASGNGGGAAAAAPAPAGNGSGTTISAAGGRGTTPAAGALPSTGPVAVATRPGRVAASPLARRVAAALGVDLAGVRGTGPGGRVVRADVEAAASAAPAAPATPAPATPAPAAPAAPPAAAAPEPAPAARADTARGEVEVHPLSRLQQTVARRMAESRATVPAFELRVDVDMSACADLRERLRALGADPLPSYTDLIVKACAVALREFPRVNGSYRGEVFEHYSRVNVGVAVAADDALVVPVVPDADRTSLGGIAKTTRRLAERVRDGSITPPELSGATFTVSNLGMYGIDSFTAIVDVPQAAILAVGAIRQQPVADADGGVVVRPVLTMTLACDHRILYGADGARFLARLRELLEQPLAFAL
jgi:pyruvate dehydrogenase E2 component (dihydrolipoamide acetyltransferase)